MNEKRRIQRDFVWLAAVFVAFLAGFAACRVMTPHVDVTVQYQEVGTLE